MFKFLYSFYDFLLSEFISAKLSKNTKKHSKRLKDCLIMELMEQRRKENYSAKLGGLILIFTAALYDCLFAHHIQGNLYQFVASSPKRNFLRAQNWKQFSGKINFFCMDFESMFC